MVRKEGRHVSKVLLVDDLPIQLNCWQRDCHKLAKIPLRASTGAEATTLAWREKPEMAIVDLFLLPPDDGVRVLTDLKSIDPTMFVVIVSSHFTTDYVMTCVNAGADDCFSKSMRAMQIIERVETGRRPEPDPGSVASLYQVEWEHISRVVNDCRGNVTRAAEALGEHRYTLQRIIQRHVPTPLRSAPVPRRKKRKAKPHNRDSRD